MIALTRSIIAAALSLGLIASGALAAGGSTTPSQKQDGYYAEAKKMIAAGNYKMAVMLLEQSVDENPANPDAYNYLGYSHRKSGNKEGALANYHKALALDPKHKGANEYLGELYLEMNDLDKAKERLDVLDQACFFGCDEYRELKTAIETFEAKRGS
jgi:Flp pilus assembly protein TadD